MTLKYRRYNKVGSRNNKRAPENQFFLDPRKQLCYISKKDCGNQLCFVATANAGLFLEVISAPKSPQVNISTRWDKNRQVTYIVNMAEAWLKIHYHLHIIGFIILVFGQNLKRQTKSIPSPLRGFQEENYAVFYNVQQIKFNRMLRLLVFNRQTTIEILPSHLLSICSWEQYQYKFCCFNSKSDDVDVFK